MTIRKPSQNLILFLQISMLKIVNQCFSYGKFVGQLQIFGEIIILNFQQSKKLAIFICNIQKALSLKRNKPYMIQNDFEMKCQTTTNRVMTSLNKSIGQSIGESIESLIQRLNREKAKNEKSSKEIANLHQKLKDKDLVIQVLAKQNEQLRNLLNGVSTMVGKAIAEDSATSSRVSQRISHGPSSTLYIGHICQQLQPITGTQVQFKVPYRPQPQQTSCIVVESKVSNMTQSSFQTEQLHNKLISKMMGMQRVSQTITQVFNRAKPHEMNDDTSPCASLSSTATRAVKCNTPLKLFENFLVVSAVEVIGQKGTTFQSKITVGFPMIDKPDRAAMVEGYCFPHGTKVKIIKSKEEAKQSLMTEFIEASLFTIRSDLSSDRTKTIDNCVLESVNPFRHLYGICLKVLGVSKTVSNSMFYETQKSYVFLTYFPFLQFFFKCIQDIISTLKKEEIEALPEISNTLALKLIPQYLNDLSKINISSFSLNYKLKWIDSGLVLSIPERIYVQEMVVGHCLGVLGGIDLEILADLIIAVLLQEKVHIFSSNVRQLFELIMTLLYVIRPLKYPLPVIFNLPLNRAPMLQSPLPGLIGLTASEQTFTNKYSFSLADSRSIYFNLDINKVPRYPNSKQLTQSKNHIKSLLIRQRILSKQPIEMYKKIRAIIRNQILIDRDQFQGVLAPFLKRFMNTQMLRNFKQDTSEHVNSNVDIE